MMYRRRFLHFAAGAVAFPALSWPVWAQAYPSRPVHLIITFPGRQRARHHRASYGAASVGTTRPAIRDREQAGPGGNIATEYVAKAEPDGYTMLMPVSTNAVNVALYEITTTNSSATSADRGVAKNPFVVVVPAAVPGGTCRSSSTIQTESRQGNMARMASEARLMSAASLPD